MKKEVNHAIRKRFNEVIYHVARYMEITEDFSGRYPVGL